MCRTRRLTSAFPVSPITAKRPRHKSSNETVIATGSGFRESWLQLDVCMNTQEVTSLFERAIGDPPQLSDADAVNLMKLLRLPLGYFVVAREAIRQERWRDKENPIGYVHTVAMAEAVKLGFEDPSEQVHLSVPRFNAEGKRLTHDDYIEYLNQGSSSGLPYKRHGVWHAAVPDWDDQEDYDEAGVELLSKLASEFVWRAEELEPLLDSPIRSTFRTGSR
jgi:hypothetical protein